MTGDNVTKLNIAKNLVEKIEDLLDGKAHYVECSDRTTYHKKIVIEYDHENKWQKTQFSIQKKIVSGATVPECYLTI